ncbi:hypothetical protein E2C01_070891 [Portunus trituberculatus]|uniref:Uncharacterized protein n=1 Tax=Portunus trituberculatus TaxID=210409 RepID=A0A5B7I6J6_PORTR|nr:hypothetical protein [Portunus trituberculatus]
MRRLPRYRLIKAALIAHAMKQQICRNHSAPSHSCSFPLLRSNSPSSPRRSPH